MPSLLFQYVFLRRMKNRSNMFRTMHNILRVDHRKKPNWNLIFNWLFIHLSTYSILITLRYIMLHNVRSLIKIKLHNRFFFCFYLISYLMKLEWFHINFLDKIMLLIVYHLIIFWSFTKWTFNNFSSVF